MRSLESLLMPGSTDRPDCRCGKEMLLADTVALRQGDAEIKVFQCAGCGFEMRLAVWTEKATPMTTTAGRRLAN